MARSQLPTAFRPAAFRPIGILFLGSLALTDLLGCVPNGQTKSLAQVDGETREMVLGDRPVMVELATTPASRERGLMHRARLADDQGMLFLYEQPATRTFWMHNVRFAIDILYLDADWRIVDRVLSAPPCPVEPCPGYPSARPARFVLELPAGNSDRFGLTLGERLTPPNRLP
ncbi:MAG: DUF192 domain-containing protein [Halothiobacillaceae bacterium]|nr:DUF192 domain-containing protein [Halothiobacillaceae bacterium]HER19527.1 DUF192 domain-containing protein [Chromatiales bacterium]